MTSSTRQATPAECSRASALFAAVDALRFGEALLSASTAWSASISTHIMEEVKILIVGSMKNATYLKSSHRILSWLAAMI